MPRTDRCSGRCRFPSSSSDTESADAVEQFGVVGHESRFDQAVDQFTPTALVCEASAEEIECAVDVSDGHVAHRRPERDLCAIGGEFERAEMGLEGLLQSALPQQDLAL